MSRLIFEWFKTVAKSIKWKFFLIFSVLTYLPTFWIANISDLLYDPGKYWRWEEKWTTEVQMVGWHHWLNGHEFVQTLGDGEGQGSLACCSPWGGLQRVGHDWVTEKQQQCLITEFLHAYKQYISYFTLFTQKETYCIFCFHFA